MNPPMNHFMSRLPLAQQQTDRDHERRSEPGLVQSLFADGATRVLVLSGGKALMRSAGDGPRLDLLVPTSPRAAVLEPAIADAVYLGRTLEDEEALPKGTSVLSVSVDEALASVIEPDARLWAGLMETAAHLGAVHCGLFTEALAITNWHDTHAFSPRTGSATSSGLAGWVRQAEGESHVSFPRTDAAIIAAVLDRDDRILLGANVRWNPRRFSLLAGFVEPGSRSKPRSHARSTRRRGRTSLNRGTSARSRGRSRRASWWASRPSSTRTRTLQRWSQTTTRSLSSAGSRATRCVPSRTASRADFYRPRHHRCLAQWSPRLTQRARRRRRRRRM